MTPGPRIVHVVCGCGFAGTERYICTVAAAQRAAGADIVVIGGDPTRMRAELDGTAVPHVAAPTVAEAVKQLRRCGQVDIVHTHLTAAEIAGAVVTRQTGAALVTTRHIAAPRGRSFATRSVSRLAATQIDVQVAISHFVASRLESSSVVLHNPVPDCRTSDRTQRVILVAQRLEPEKATAAAVLAFSSSGLAAEGWTLDIAGDGSDRARVEATIDSAELRDAVRMLGHVTDVGARRSSASLFLATATAEPFGLSVAEAMASALPVVATASGGHIETVGAVAPELLYVPGHHAAAGALLRQLASDPSRASTLGEHLQRHQQEHLSVTAHLDGLTEAYERALAHRDRRRPGITPKWTFARR